MLNGFDSIVEFMPDHRVVTWMKIPAGISEEQIRQAIESGEISEARDGMFTAESGEWKAANGKYYYNTGSSAEIFGEKQSPWEELKPDEDGRYKFSSGMTLIERI